MQKMLLIPVKAVGEQSDNLTASPPVLQITAVNKTASCADFEFSNLMSNLIEIILNHLLYGAGHVITAPYREEH